MGVSIVVEFIDFHPFLYIQNPNCKEVRRKLKKYWIILENNAVWEG